MSVDLQMQIPRDHLYIIDKINNDNQRKKKSKYCNLCTNL